MNKFLPVIIISALIFLGKYGLDTFNNKKNLDIVCTKNMDIRTPEGRYCKKQEIQIISFSDSFPIEGISIGESLLKYYSKTFIENNFTNLYPNSDNKFLTLLIRNLKVSSPYEYVQVMYKKNDPKFIVHSIDGMFDFKDVNECYLIQNELEEDFDVKFKDGTKKTEVLKMFKLDESDTSKVNQIRYEFKEFIIAIDCYHFSDASGMPNGLNVSSTTHELKEWLSQPN